jgi:hypothetical protein
MKSNRCCCLLCSRKTHLQHSEFVSSSTNSSSPSSTWRGSPNKRLLGLTLLATLPALAAQAVVAWIGLVIRSRGQPPEEQPRSVLGYFFAVFWHGDAQQCNGELG